MDIYEHRCFECEFPNQLHIFTPFSMDASPYGGGAPTFPYSIHSSLSPQLSDSIGEKVGPGVSSRWVTDAGLGNQGVRGREGTGR